MKHVKRVHRGKPASFGELLGEITGLSPEDVALIVRMGGAYVGKARCKQVNQKIKSGQEISAWFRFPLEMEPVPFQKEWILHQDKQILVAAKPMGLPTQGRRDADYMAFYELLKSQVKGYLGLHHRLDQDTSGLMLYARSRELNKDIARAFQERFIEKCYLAVVRGSWPFKEERVLVKDPIHSSHGPKGTRHFVASAGKAAQTWFQCLAQHEDLCLVLAQPKTGRTHQIRVHAAHHGMPLLADSFYGEPTEGSFFLHCMRLTWKKLGKLNAGDFKIRPPERWQQVLPRPLLDPLEQWWRNQEC